MLEDRSLFIGDNRQTPGRLFPANETLVIHEVDEWQDASWKGVPAPCAFDIYMLLNGTGHTTFSIVDCDLTANVHWHGGGTPRGR